jgi:hypothetical protein
MSKVIEALEAINSVRYGYYISREERNGVTAALVQAKLDEAFIEAYKEWCQAVQEYTELDVDRRAMRLSPEFKKAQRAETMKAVTWKAREQAVKEGE